MLPHAAPLLNKWATRKEISNDSHALSRSRFGPTEINLLVHLNGADVWAGGWTGGGRFVTNSLCWTSGQQMCQARPALVNNKAERRTTALALLSVRDVDATHGSLVFLAALCCSWEAKYATVR